MNLRLLTHHTAPLLLAAWMPLAAWANPSWLTADGRPLPAAHEAVRWLNEAAADGLEPADYGAQHLSDALAAAAARGLDAASAVALDQELTQAVERYLYELHGGRIDPARLNERYDHSRRPQPDLRAALQTALADGQIQQARDSAIPRVPMYPALRALLAQYRAMGAHPAWAQPLPALPGRKLTPGQPWEGLGVLAERLVALGDLPPQPTGEPPAASAPAQYTPALVEAVTAFQRRHGLEADGVLGATTLAALNVPPAARAEQIALQMERLRWTPVLQGPRMIAVNVPEYRLRAYEYAGGRVTLRMSMAVIVGKALDTRTPLFDEDMQSIEFSPYWNIPPSIARGETVPRLRRDPGYLARQGMEFVSAAGVSTDATPEMLGAVLAGQARIRQRPGPLNALGDIKFVLPNNDNIYLHHTSAPTLFGRSRRDLSHGCVRVEEPVALAQFVLQDDPTWTVERIRAAMAQPKPVFVRLPHPVPVIITHITVVVQDGRPHFYGDLYGHDRKLASLLRQHSAKPYDAVRAGSAAGGIGPK